MIKSPTEELKSIRDVPSRELFEGGSPCCQGCPGELGLKLALKALGRETVVVNSSGCMTLLCNFPYTPLRVSWIHSAIENAAATATGVVRALKRLGREATVLCYAGDGATYDIGFQSLSAAAVRRDPFVYVCYNNQSYANTGVQWASSTPIFADTKTTPPGAASQGNPLRTKDMVRIMADHNIYAATASLAFPLDFMNKVRKAAALRETAYIELLAACPPGWGFDSSQTVRISKSAVETGFWPLYEIEKGRVKISYKPAQLRPAKDFLSTQARFRHLSSAQASEVQKIINEQWVKLLEEEKK